MKPSQISIAVVAFVAAFFLPAVRADCPLEESGHWGGTVTETIDHDGLLYAAIGRRLDVIDASIPGTPRRLGQVTFPGYVYGLALEGQTAYVISAGALHVVDVSDCSSPRMVGAIEVPQPVTATGSLAVRNGTAYCMRTIFDPQRITVVDVSSPESPSIAGTLELPSNARDLAAVGQSHLYLHRDGGGLLVFDLSAPHAPSLVGEVLLSETIRSLDFGGAVPVAAIEERGLVTLDFSDPLMPLILGQSGELGRVFRVRSRGTRVTAIGGHLNEDFAIFSVEDPSSPTLQTILDSRYGFNLAAIGESYIAASARIHENIDFFANPLPNVIYPTGRYHEAQRQYGEIAAEGDHLFIPSGDVMKVVRAVGTATPQTVAVYQLRPITIAGHTVPDRAEHVIIANGYAYLTSEFQGLTILDVSDPSLPQVVNETDDQRWFARIRDGRAYTGYNGFQIYDLSDPVSPRLLGEAPLDDPAALIDVDGSLACLVGHETFTVVDVSDPTKPTVLASVPAENSEAALALYGRTAYVAIWGRLPYAYDLSDPAQPTRRDLRGDFGIRHTVTLRIRDGILYSGTHGGLWISDLSDPYEPRLLARTDHAGIVGLGLMADHAAVSFWGGETSIVPLFLPGDIDGDQNVDLADLALLLSLFGQFVGGGPGNGDFNCDGWVDLSDLTTMLSTFGTRR